MTLDAVGSEILWIKKEGGYERPPQVFLVRTVLSKKNEASVPMHRTSARQYDEGFLFMRVNVGKMETFR